MLSQFDEYRLSTEFSEGYCKHTIAHEAGFRTQRWKKGSILGRGTFGTVWLEEEEEQGFLRAVKQISKTHILMNSRELLALTKLRAFPQYFVQFSGWFEGTENIYLTMEYIKYGDLDRFIHKYNIPESSAKVITVQLLEGLKIMHENGFCHRDLKPQNILIASLSPITVKISDFGVTKQEEDGTQLRTNVGTFSYMAPEIIDDFFSSGTSVYTNAVDIWSLGCVIHTIMTKKTPFMTRGELDGYMMGRTPFPEKRLVESGASLAAVKIITKLVMPLPEDRLTAEQALKDPWFNLGVVEGDGDDTFWPDTVAIKPQDLEFSPVQIPKDPLNEHMQTAIHDCTTICCAITHGNLDAMRRKLQDPGTNVNEWQSGSTTTLLHMVASSSNSETLRGEMTTLLLDEGADATAVDIDGYTAVSYAVLKGHSNMMKLFRERGVDVGTRDKTGYTLLHSAVSRNDGEMTQLLLDYGSNTEALEGSGQTALHIATRHGYKRVAKLLLKGGADLAAEDNYGRTPLQYAVLGGHESMVGLLRKYENIGARNRAGPRLYNAAVKGSRVLRKFILGQISNIGACMHSTLRKAFEIDRIGTATVLISILKLLRDLGSDAQKPGGRHYIVSLCDWIIAILEQYCEMHKPSLSVTITGTDTVITTKTTRSPQTNTAPKASIFQRLLFWKPTVPEPKAAPDPKTTPNTKATPDPEARQTFHVGGGEPDDYDGDKSEDYGSGSQGYGNRDYRYGGLGSGGGSPDYGDGSRGYGDGSRGYVD